MVPRVPDKRRLVYAVNLLRITNELRRQARTSVLADGVKCLDRSCTPKTHTHTHAACRGSHLAFLASLRHLDQRVRDPRAAFQPAPTIRHVNSGRLHSKQLVAED
eukprot:3871363-Rhodomonas_salina.1